MKVCFFCDLHLPFMKSAIQYDAFDWAIRDIKKKKADCVIFCGDATSDGNIDVYEYFIQKMKFVKIPFLYIPGNSDLRDRNSSDTINKQASETLTIINGIKIIAINDSDRSVSSEQLKILNMADENTLVFMHHPIECLKSIDRRKLLTWRKKHHRTMLFCGHEHVSYMHDNLVGLQALDPDKAIGESPCITYFDTYTREITKSYYVCTVPTDAYDFLGISCYDIKRDINFAINNGLKCLELRPNAISVDQDLLLQLINKWRELGGTNLSIHLSEVFYEKGKVYADENYVPLIELGKKIRVDRYTQHVPIVSANKVHKDITILDKIAEFIAENLNIIDHPFTLGVENMHMVDGEKPFGKRRFGYTPEETLAFVNALSNKIVMPVGVNFDIGHARNNRPFSQKYQIGTWMAMLGGNCIGYHLHQVALDNGKFINHTAITDIYGKLISFASFFRSWSKGKIARAPIIFEMRTENAYKITLDTFNKVKKENLYD